MKEKIREDITFVVSYSLYEFKRDKNLMVWTWEGTGQSQS